MNRILIFLIAFGFTQSGFGYFSLMDTGKVTKMGDYKIMGEGQIPFDGPKGFNLNGRFATGLYDDSEVQFEAGLGSIDYYIGAFYKWVPFPDTDSQPAIGLRSGLTFSKLDYATATGTSAYSTYGANITPFASKEFETGIGSFTPYAGVQIGLQKNTFDTNFTLQLTAGTEWSPNEWDMRELKDFSFLIEYGLEIDDAFNYLSFGATYSF